MPCHASARRFCSGAAASPLCVRSASPPPGTADLSLHNEQGRRLPFPYGKTPPVSSVRPAGLAGRLALAFVDLLEVGVHDLLVALAAAGLAAILAARAAAVPAGLATGA